MMIREKSVSCAKIAKGYYLVMLFFACVFCLVSFVNHYQFRTYSFDLGLYNQAIFDYSHGRLNQSTLLEPDFHQRNQLADHFDLWLILISPLYYIFGNSTLLLIQILAILFGGLGISKSTETFSNNKWIPFLAMIHFFSLWGIYAALSFDYHSNVIAAMFVPWLFYFLQRNKSIPAVLMFVLILICKENMALWAVFIGSGFAWYYRKDKLKRNLCLGLMFFAILYFVLVMKIFMPSFSIDSQKYIHFDFKALGSNFMEAIQTILQRPIYAASLLFESPYIQHETYWIKTELFSFILLCGGFALFFNPAFIWMLLPILGQKLFNDDFTKWGINHQYSIEFAPILSLALFIWITQIKYNNKVKIALIMIAITIAMTIKGMQSRISIWYDEKDENIFCMKHYQRAFDIKEIHKVIKQIPPEYSVSASSTLTAHLAGRKQIYQFPYINNAQLLLLLAEPESYYPLSESEFKTKFVALQADSNYVCTLNHNPFYIFVRKDVSFSVKD